ncbi:MAG: 50S ribosomal protein L21 [Bacteroidetes bacterium]|nr:50S ribosomal protein L21 [Bacteroidota bacterium]MBL6943852.1 50S ribosomal protein L21 [Bacteroidales bacterium]
MYVVVDIAGQQFKVEQGQEVMVNRLEGEEGEKVVFDKVLLVDNDGKVKVGKPLVKGAAIDAQIISHLRDDKVVVFKKKRRKSYQKSNGFRRDMSKVLIEKITV